MLTDQSTVNIILIMTTGGNVLVSLIKSYFDSKRGNRIEDATHEIHEKASFAIVQNEKIEKQTNGNYSELMKQFELLKTENNSLRESHGTLEKAIIALTASKPVIVTERQIRATDKP